MKRTVLIEVSFHIGELYFLIPFLYSIQKDSSVKFVFVFTKRSVYIQFRKDPLLSLAAQKFGAIVVCVYFDILQRRNSDGALAHLVTAANKFHRRMNGFDERIAELLRSADYCLIQFAGGYFPGVMRRKNISGPRVLKYPHTSGPTLYDPDEAKKRVPVQRAGPGDVLLVLDPDSIPYYRLAGFRNFVALGYHSVSEEWVHLINKIRKPKEPYALIFSYMPRSSVLPKEKWEILHQSTYLSVRCIFQDINIIIKPHPNQNIRELKRFIRINNWRNVYISTQNSMILAIGAKFGVGFLTSGIYNTLLFDVPSINYFNARQEYISSVGSYKQNYSSLGIPDVEEEHELRVFLRKVRSNEIVTRFGSRKKSLEKIKSFAQFEKRVAALASS